MKVIAYIIYAIIFVFGYLCGASVNQFSNVDSLRAMEVQAVRNNYGEFVSGPNGRLIFKWREAK